jgi:hypothetical protein
MNPHCYLAYSSTLKMEATCSSEKSVDLTTEYMALYLVRQNSSLHGSAHKFPSSYRILSQVHPFRILLLLPSTGQLFKIQSTYPTVMFSK